MKINKKWAIALMTAGLGSSAWAVPVLQLDVLGGYWVGEPDATTYSASNPFSLRALIDPSLVGRTFYLSAAIVPKQGETSTNFGSFLIGSTFYDASNNMQFGTPPVDDELKNLQAHGIFETWYAELAFTAGGDTVGAYNVEPESTDQPKDGDMLNYVDFNVDISGLSSYAINDDGTYASTLLGVHFDLYSYDDTGNKIDYFAPFSHDAQSGTHGIIIVPPPPPPPVPDGGTTLLLLGTAMTGLGLLRSKLGVKKG